MSNVCDISGYRVCQMIFCVSNFCDISGYRVCQMFVIFQGTERVKCLCYFRAQSVSNVCDISGHRVCQIFVIF